MQEMTQAQFEAVIKAVNGTIDYEYLLLMISDYYFRRSKELKASGMDAAYDREFKKGEKILDNVCVFRKLNEELA